MKYGIVELEHHVMLGYPPGYLAMALFTDDGQYEIDAEASQSYGEPSIVVNVLDQDGYQIGRVIYCRLSEVIAPHDVCDTPIEAYNAVFSRSLSQRDLERRINEELEENAGLDAYIDEELYRQKHEKWTIIVAILLAIILVLIIVFYLLDPNFMRG